MTAALVVFWILAVVSVGAAVAMVANPNPVRSALALVVTFLCVAAFYITLSAQFIAAVQIIVYAGAIMVLFLFVIMLLNLGAPQALRAKDNSRQPLIAVCLAIVLVGTLIGFGTLMPPPATPITQQQADQLGTVQSVGLSLYSPNQPWLFPFELTSILLLVAVVGAIVMAKRRI